MYLNDSRVAREASVFAFGVRLTMLTTFIVSGAAVNNAVYTMMEFRDYPVWDEIKLVLFVDI